MSPSHSSFIEPVWIIGFTGHRPSDESGRTKAELIKLEPTISAQLQKLAELAKERGGRADLLCGLAVGADLLAARAAWNLKMAVHVILPLPEEVFLAHKDFLTDPDAKAEAQFFISAAKRGEHKSTFRVARGSHLEPECYSDLGHQIVEASDAILAVWDGKPPVSEKPGSTAEVVKLAQADQMPYLKEGKKLKDGYRWLPTPCIRIDSKTGTVSGDVSVFASTADAGYAEFHEVAHAAANKLGSDAGDGTMKSLLSRLDEHATDWAKTLRWTLVGGVFLHGIASLTAAGSAAWQLLLGTDPHHDLAVLMTASELALISTAMLLGVFIHWRHGQARWIELRLATELLRGLVDSRQLLDPLYPLVTQHLPGWRRFCLSVGLRIVAQHGQKWELEDEIPRYQKDRIDEQVKHFTEKNPARHAWFRIAHRIGPVAGWLAIPVVLAAFCYKLGHHETDPCQPLIWWQTLVYKFLPIALPLIAGVSAALQSVNDAPRRAQVYPEIIQRLLADRHFADAIRSKPGFRRLVARTEEVLLDELVGWYAAAKGISH